MARRCGILKIALREDEPGEILRVAAEDVQGELVQGQPIEPGHYACCDDAYRRFAPKVLERLKKTPALGHDGHPAFHADGERKMVVAADATLETVDKKLLM